MPHPGNHGSFGTLLDRDSFRSGDGATTDRRGMIGDGTGESAGEISVSGMKGQKRHDGFMKVFDVLGLRLLSKPSDGFSLLTKLFVDRSTSSSARMRSMAVAGAQMPLEKILRPFFS